MDDTKTTTTTETKTTATGQTLFSFFFFLEVRVRRSGSEGWMMDFAGLVPATFLVYFASFLHYVLIKN